MKHQDLQQTILQLAQPLDDYLNPGREPGGPRTVGFLLCAFDFGDSGSLAYLSNATQETLRPAMKELIDKLATSGVLISMAERPRS